MDLFEYAREKNMDREAPLASRLRPVTLEEVVGQQHIIGKDKLLYRAIKADNNFLRAAGDGKDDPCEGDCQYDKCKVHPD